MNRDFLYDTIGHSNDFYWYEAIYQNRWRCHVIPTEDILKNIVTMAHKAQKIRNILGLPMMVTSWYRSPAYNKLIGGAPSSYHCQGKAMDFMCPGVHADDIRKELKPRLKALGIRMENLPGSTWVHIDIGRVKYGRFFRP